MYVYECDLIHIIHLHLFDNGIYSSIFFSYGMYICIHFFNYRRYFSLR